MPRKPVIVGIDPGTTTAIAFLDAHGNFLSVESSKKYSKPDIRRKISEEGNVLIIATDKSDIPNTVKEIATQFKCKLYSPDKDLSREEKSSLTEEYKDIISNEHEKDALASALKAYKSYSHQFEKIKRFNPDNYEEVVRKEFLDIEEREEKENEFEKVVLKKNSSDKEKINNLEEKVRRLQGKLRERESKIKELDKGISDLRELEGMSEKEAYLKSRILRLKNEKRELENKLDDFAEHYEKDDIKTMDEEEMKRKIFTESEETFKELVEKEKEVYLIDVLHEKPSKIYYIQIDYYEPDEDMVKKVLDEYRKKRTGR